MLNSHKCLAKGAPRRHRTKSMSTHPLGGFSHHQSTRLTQYTVICSAGTLSNTYYIFLLLFTNTTALMHCKTWRGYFLSQARMDDHCVFSQHATEGTCLTVGCNVRHTSTEVLVILLLRSQPLLCDKYTLKHGK